MRSDLHSGYPAADYSQKLPVSEENSAISSLVRLLEKLKTSDQKQFD